MGRQVKVTPGAAAKASEGQGTYKPLPAGKVNVSIFEHSVTSIKGGANKGVEGINIQFKVSEGQKGSNRRLFTHVWETEKWATGASNFLYFQFYKALGVDFDVADGETVELPDYDELNGEELTVKLKIVPDTYAYEKAVEEYEGDRSRAEAKGAEALEKFDAANDAPSKGDYLKNEIAAFFPLEDIAGDDDLAAEDDEEGFDL